MKTRSIMKFEVPKSARCALEYTGKLRNLKDLYTQITSKIRDEFDAFWHHDTLHAVNKTF